MRYREWQSQQPADADTRLPAFIAWKRAQAPAPSPLPDQPALAATAPSNRPARRKTVAGKITSFLAAVTGPTVEPQVYAERLAICLGNECRRLKQDQGKAYCRACGCGEWRLAELHTKLWHANLECPLDPPMWGKVG